MRNFHKRVRRRARGFKLPWGLKLQYVPGSDGYVETLYFAKERKRRRRRNGIAKQSRKRNRA